MVKENSWDVGIGRGYTLARLAVASSVAGNDFGGDLLVDAMRRTKQVSNQVGGAFLFVDAKDQKAAEFYRHFGFMPLPDDPLTLAMPMSSIDGDWSGSVKIAASGYEQWR
jgi:predicted GNAT family N-acyltransferase